MKSEIKTLAVRCQNLEQFQVSLDSLLQTRTHAHKLTHTNSHSQAHTRTYAYAQSLTHTLPHLLAQTSWHLLPLPLISFLLSSLPFLPSFRPSFFLSFLSFFISPFAHRYIGKILPSVDLFIGQAIDWFSLPSIFSSIYASVYPFSLGGEQREAGDRSERVGRLSSSHPTARSQNEISHRKLERGKNLCYKAILFWCCMFDCFANIRTVLFCTFAPSDPCILRIVVSRHWWVTSRGSDIPVVAFALKIVSVSVKETARC